MNWFVDLIFISTLVIISGRIFWTDLKFKLIPNKYLLVFTIIVLVYVSILSYKSSSINILTNSISAGILCFIIFLIFYLIKPSGIGAGDVKLAGTIGFLIGQFGIELAVICVLFSFILSLPFALYKLIEKNKHDEFAFGPFLIISLWAFFIMLKK